MLFNKKNILFFLKPDKFLLATCSSSKKNFIDNITEIKFEESEIINQNIFNPTKIQSILTEFIKKNNLKKCKAFGAVSHRFCHNFTEPNSLFKEYVFTNNEKFENLKHIFRLKSHFIFQIQSAFQSCNVEIKNLTFDKICHLFLKQNLTKHENQQYMIDFFNESEVNFQMNNKDLYTIFGLYLMGK